MTRPFGKCFCNCRTSLAGMRHGDLASLLQARRIGTPQRGSSGPSSLLVQLGRLSPKRHPEVADAIMLALVRAAHIEAARHCREHLQGVGFDAPEWGDLVRGVRPGYDPLVDDLPQLSTQGWQHFASEAVEASFLADTIWPRLDVPHQALMRSQQGPMAGIPFTCMPLSSESRFQPQEFRVLLLRRLWQPLPLSSSICRCGRPLDSRGHHRAACSVAGVLGRRGFCGAPSPGFAGEGGAHVL